MVPSKSHAELVAEVLAKHWRIVGPAIKTHRGVSRATWQLGSSYWLSQAESTRFAELSRQATLLHELNGYLKEEESSIQVPEIVPGDNGSLVVTDGEYVWCLTRHLPGVHSDASVPGLYPVLADGLARFHQALRAFAERLPLHVIDGICVRTRQNVERLSSRKFIPITSDPHEYEVLRQASEWLLPRLDRFERIPRQLVHGDWTPGNVLFDRADLPTHLTAVLDFEAMSKDPVHVDAANICSTLLMWSGLECLDAHIATVLNTYERATGMNLELHDIHTAMLAHWFCHYWSWRDRLRHGEFGREVKGRLCLRISSVLSHVSKLSADSN